MGLIGFFAMQDDELETQNDWRIIFFASLVIIAICLVGIIMTPERTKKRRRLDAEDPVASPLAQWYIEHRKIGKVNMPFYFVATAANGNVYLSSDVQKPALKVLNEINAEQRLIPLIEKRYAKGLTKQLKQFAAQDIKTLKATQRLLEVTTADGSVASFSLSDQVDLDEVAITVASLVMPGVPGERSVDQVETGVVRKKTLNQESLVFSR